MDALTGLIVALLLGVAASGAGYAALTALGITTKLAPVERAPMAAIIGTGALGWLTFFPGVAGYLTTPALIAVVSAGMAGFLTARFPSPVIQYSPLPTADRLVAKLLLVTLAIIVLFDLLSAFAPPADADTLA